MGDLLDCPGCGAIFISNGIKDSCDKCYQKEEDLYQIVYRFLRKRENRAATIDRIEEATGADRSLIHKWVRKGRLHPATFPNLGYPCDNCGGLTKKGKICEKCKKNIESDLKTFEAAKEFREEIKKRENNAYKHKK